MAVSIDTRDLSTLNENIDKMESQIKPIKEIIANAKILGRDVSLLDSNLRVIESMVNSLKAERQLLVDQVK